MKAVARTRRHRVILLTGCRSGEIGRLKSYEVEPAKLILGDAKTGVSFLPMPVESLQCHTAPN